MPIDPKFIESFPLYKTVVCRDIPTDSQALWQGRYYPPVILHCEKCKSNQTFRQTHVVKDDPLVNRQGIALQAHVNATRPQATYAETAAERERFYRSAGSVLLVVYVCAACDQCLYRFLLRIGEDQISIMKVGQYPPWSIEPTDSMKRALGDHLSVFKKGLINESQGYGIGGFSYYRRIVEDMMESVLNDIGDVIGDHAEKEKYRQALQNVKESQSAAARIEVVKELLPASLRPGGINPLGVIYEALSDGLHARSDEECLEIAGALRESLAYLVDAVTEQKKKADDYKKQISGLLTKMNKAGRTKRDVK